MRDESRNLWDEMRRSNCEARACSCQRVRDGVATREMRVDAARWGEARKARGENAEVNCEGFLRGENVDPTVAPDAARPGLAVHPHV